jgi:hypothetical protein
MVIPFGAANIRLLESLKGLTITASREVEGIQRPRKSKLTRRRIHNQKSPIATLPPELLSYIFELSFLSPSEPSYPPFEILVSHVTSYWRSVALTTRILWSKIDASPQTPLGLIEMYLQRSKLHPLDLRFDFFRIPGVTSAETDGLCDLFIPHIGRCSQLFIEGELGTPVTTMLSRISNVAAPFLTCLHIAIEAGFADQDSRSEEFGPQIFTAGTPLLSELLLAGVALRHCRPPLTAITSLQLNEVFRMRMSYARFSDMVNACPSLTYLSLRHQVVEPDSWPVEFKSPPLHLHSLLSLEFQGYPDCISNLLLVLCAPKLESLSLIDVHVNAFAQLFHAKPVPTFPSLRLLSLDLLKWNKTSYVNLYKAFPSVTHLELSCHVARHTSLTLGQFSPTLLPHLHSLTIRHVPYNEDQESHDCIYELVPERVSAGYPLTKVCIDRAEEAATDRVEWLSELVELEIFDDDDG